MLDPARKQALTIPTLLQTQPFPCQPLLVTSFSQELTPFFPAFQCAHAGHEQETFVTGLEDHGFRLAKGSSRCLCSGVEAAHASTIGSVYWRGFAFFGGVIVERVAGECEIPAAFCSDLCYTPAAGFHHFPIGVVTHVTF